MATSRESRTPHLCVRWPSIFEVVICAIVCLLFAGCGLGSDSRSKKPSIANMSQIGRGLRLYHDAHLTFPPGAVHDADDRPHHSWQAMLLPFLGDPSLSAQINFHVPWNDASNEAAFQTEVSAYLVPQISSKRDVNGYALSHYAGSKNFFPKNKGLRVRDVRDGTIGTIVAGEVGRRYAAWGDPGNLRDPAVGLNSADNSFGRPSGNGACFLFADGSVHFLSNEVDPGVLAAFSTPQGGESTPDPKKIASE